MSLERSVQTVQQTQNKSALSAGILQRKCGCGQHTLAGGQCSECRRGRLNLRNRTDYRGQETTVFPADHGGSFSDGRSFEKTGSSVINPSFGGDFSRVPAATVWPMRSAPMIQRKALASGNGRFRIPPEIIETIKRKLGKGWPLEASVRFRMEALLGGNFDQVRIHTDPESQRITKALRARAVSVGQDIFFAEGAYDPDSMQGRKLLAHELAHVLRRTQQGISAPNLPLEVVTDQVEEIVAESAEKKVEAMDRLDGAGSAEEKELMITETALSEAGLEAAIPEPEFPEEISQVTSEPGVEKSTTEAPQ